MNGNIRQHIIENAVKNMHDFGYEHATKDNIFTDEVYRKFFRSMIKSNLGSGATVDEVLNCLLRELDDNEHQVQRVCPPKAKP